MNPGQEQWLVGKFTYGTIDKDIHDEDVEVWVRRRAANGSCAWENLGTARTTENPSGTPDLSHLRGKGLQLSLLLLREPIAGVSFGLNLGLLKRAKADQHLVLFM